MHFNHSCHFWSSAAYACSLLVTLYIVVPLFIIHFNFSSTLFSIYLTFIALSILSFINQFCTDFRTFSNQSALLFISNILSINFISLYYFLTPLTFFLFLMFYLSTSHSFIYFQKAITLSLYAVRSLSGNFIFTTHPFESSFYSLPLVLITFHIRIAKQVLSSHIFTLRITLSRGL